jgi:6-phosphogluconate dehydrogenase
LQQLEGEGSIGTGRLEDFVNKLSKPRAAWVMVPAAFAEQTTDQLAEMMEPGDVVIDGGNSYYRDDIDRAERYAEQGVHYVDVGTSGGVFGLERGFCLMIGGEDEVVQRLDPIFATHRAGRRGGRRTPGRRRDRPPPRPATCTAARRRRPLREDGPQRDRVRAHGRVRRGPERPQHAGRRRRARRGDAETTPLRDPSTTVRPRHPEIAEVWRRGSVVASWLLDLTAAALVRGPRARGVRRARVRLGRGPLDGARRGGRGRAGRTCCRRTLVEPVRVSRRVRVRRYKILSAFCASSSGGHAEKTS